MTTHQYADVIAHTSDATFRAWGSALASALATAGLVQTSDTGQINWTTVTRPVTGTVGGYEIWRFNDSLQASAPIYIKLEYGTGSSSTTPAMWITVGSGTNGAGTLTGTTSTRVQMAQGAPQAGSFNTQICVKDGFLGVAFKNGAVSSTNKALWVFGVGRSCDSTGAETSEGAYVITTTTSTLGNWQTLNFTGLGAFTAYINGCLVAGHVTSSVVGSDVQVYKHYGNFPRMRALLHVATAINTEITAGTTFTKALVGSTARTYLSLGTFAPGWGSLGASGIPHTAHGLCMLWE